MGWRRGVVVSGVRRMNEVNARRARLVPGWVTVFGRVCNQPTTGQPGTSAGFWLGGQCPLAAWGEENSGNLTTKWCILKYI